MIVLLFWLKTRTDFKVMGGMFKVGEAAINTAVNRARGCLFDCLTERHERTIAERPIPLSNPELDYVALVVDSTSIEVFRPTAYFNEAKKYWDAKNHKYAIKKQVMIEARPPHRAMFIEPGKVGSTHDMTIFVGSLTR